MSLDDSLALRIRRDARLEIEELGDHLEIAHLAIDLARALEGARLGRRKLERRLVVHHRAVFAKEKILENLTKLEQMLRFLFLGFDLLGFALELFDEPGPIAHGAQALLDLLAELHERYPHTATGENSRAGRRLL